MRVARYRAFTAGIDAEDLLQEAILRTLTSRSCPAGLKVEHFLMAVMRSIASAIIAKRKRDETLYCDESDLPVAPLAPDEACEIAQRADACRIALETLFKGSTMIERVVDGIDQGLCGKALADFASMEQAELATTRRLIKRRAMKAWSELNSLELAA
ncbi:MAG: hypothetical protein CL808_00135 [Citromicrobium sp.]|nr:hypothetical protein [Citromicrobium sp.]